MVVIDHAFIAKGLLVARGWLSLPDCLEARALVCALLLLELHVFNGVLGKLCEITLQTVDARVRWLRGFVLDGGLGLGCGPLVI